MPNLDIEREWERAHTTSLSSLFRIRRNLLVIDGLWAAVAAVGVAGLGGNVTMLDVTVIGHGHAWQKELF